MLESSPEEHACRRGSAFQPENPRRFMSCVKKEMALLQSALPPGILVRGYEDRMVGRRPVAVHISYMKSLKRVCVGNDIAVFPEATSGATRTAWWVEPQSQYIYLT